MDIRKIVKFSKNLHSKIVQSALPTWRNNHQRLNYKRAIALTLLSVISVGGLSACGRNVHPNTDLHISYNQPTTIRPNQSIAPLLDTGFSSPDLDKIMVKYFGISDSDMTNSKLFSSSFGALNPKAIFKIKNNTLYAKPWLYSKYNFKKATSGNDVDSDGGDIELYPIVHINNNSIIFSIGNISSDSDSKYDEEGLHYLKIQLHNIAYAKHGKSIKYTFYPVEKKVNKSTIKIPENKGRKMPIVFETKPVIHFKYKKQSPYSSLKNSDS